MSSGYVACGLLRSPNPLLVLWGRIGKMREEKGKVANGKGGKGKERGRRGKKWKKR